MSQLKYNKEEVDKIMNEIHVDVFEKTLEKIDTYQLAILRFNVINNERITQTVNSFEKKMDEMHKVVTQKTFKTIYFDGKKTAFWYGIGKYGIGGISLSIAIILASLLHYYKEENKRLPKGIKEDGQYYVIEKDNVIVKKNTILLKKGEF